MTSLFSKPPKPLPLPAAPAAPKKTSQEVADEAFQQRAGRRRAGGGASNILTSAVGDVSETKASKLLLG